MPVERARKAMIRKQAVNCCTCIFCALYVRTSYGSTLGAKPLPLPLQKTEDTTAWLGIWEVCFALLFITGLILGIRWLFFRAGFYKSPSAGSAGRSIQILERKQIGAGQSLLLIRCCDTQVLLHQSKGRLSTLCVVEREKDKKREDAK